MKFEELAARARNAYKIQDFALAESLALQLIQKSPDNSGLRIFSGNIYTKTNSFNKAVNEYQKSIELKPENPQAYNNIGIVYKKENKLKVAEEAFKTAFNFTPRRADICYNMGNIYKQMGDIERAVKFYKKAIELNPRFVFSYNNLGTLYEKQGKYNEAGVLYKKGLSVDNNHPTLRYNLGVAFQSDGDNESAVKEFRHALKSRPGWVDGLNNLGVALQNTGDPEQALKTFKRILSIAPDNARVNNNIGVILTEQGNYKEAENYLKKALSENPEYTKAALNLEEIHQEEGEIELAFKGLKRILHNDPENTEVRLQMGKVLTKMHKYKDAANHLRFIIKNNPEHLEACLAMGNLYFKIGKKRKAINYYKHALIINPGSIAARMQLALIYKEQGKIEKAIAQISHMLSREPSAFSPKLLLGELYLKQNLYTEALAVFEELYDRFPDNENILSALIHNYKAMGNKEKAILAAEKLAYIQGAKGTASDLTNLHTTLQLYEIVANEYAKDYEEIWDRNIKELVHPRKTLSEELKGKEEESLIFEEIPDLDGETVPIIDVGGIESVIGVREEEDTLILSEEDEYIPSLPEEDPEKEQEKEIPVIVQPKEGVTSSSKQDGFQQLRGGAPPEANIPPYQAEQFPVCSSSPPSRQIPAIVFPETIKIESPIIIKQDTPQIITPSESSKITVIKDHKKHPDDEQKITENELPHARIPEEKSSDLLGYLEHLAGFLPEKQRSSFENSEMKLKIESLREKLKGKKGLKNQIEQNYSVNKKNQSIQMTKDKITDTLSFMSNLSDYHPDKEIGHALKDKIAFMLNTIKRE